MSPDLTSSLSAIKLSNSVQEVTGDEIIPEVPFNSKIPISYNITPCFISAKVEIYILLK